MLETWHVPGSTCHRAFPSLLQAQGPSVMGVSSCAWGQEGRGVCDTLWVQWVPSPLTQPKSPLVAPLHVVFGLRPTYGTWDTFLQLLFTLVSPGRIWAIGWSPRQDSY